MFSHFEFSIILVALTFSAFIKGSLGLGFSTITLAILANFIDLKVAIALTIIPSLFSNLMIMQSVGNFRLSLHTFRPLFMAAGSIDLNRAAWFSLGIVPVILGIWSGSKLRNHLSEQRYRQAMMVFIMILGICLLQGLFQ